MIDIAEARRLAEKQLRSRLGQWAGECAGDVPAAVASGADAASRMSPASPMTPVFSKTPAFSLGLKPPTEREALADSAAAEDWVRAWRAAEELSLIHI